MSNLNLNSVTSLDTGREVDVNRVMQTVDYVGGLVIDSMDTVIVDGDNRYVLAASTVLPYTTTGAGMPEGVAFVSVGDAVLRQELAAPGGAGLVAGGVVIHRDNIDELKTIDTTSLTDGQLAEVASYYAGWQMTNNGPRGGGKFVWNTTSTAVEDGGVTIAVPGVATGRWVRQLNGFVTPDMFGARGDYNEADKTGTDDRLPCQKALDYIKNSAVSVLRLTSNYYLDSSADSNHTLYISDKKEITIEGLGFTTGLFNSDNIITHVIAIHNSSIVTIKNVKISGRDPEFFSGGHRHINLTSCREVYLDSLYLFGSGRYSISHQTGTLRRMIANNITFEKIGNDCIDIKNVEFATDSTKNFCISNIIVKSFGLNNSAGFPPHAVIDCRAPVSITNLIIEHMGASCAGIRLFGDAQGSLISNVRCDSSVSASGLTGNERTSLIKIDGQSFHPRENKKTTISNIYSNGCFYGVWVTSAAGDVIINGGDIIGAYDGVYAGNTSENVKVNMINFYDSIRADVTLDSKNSSVSLCSSYRSGSFVRASTFTERLVMVFNYVDDTTASAWTIPGDLIDTGLCSFYGNTGKAGYAPTVLRDRGIPVFKADTSNSELTSMVAVRNGGSAGVVYVDGLEPDIDLSLVPKGAGKVRLGGAAIGTADSPVTAYIEVKDANGVIRKLAVIS